MNIIEFKNWKPEVYKVPIKQLSNKLKEAIVCGKFGIYMPADSDIIRVYHGNEDISYDLCKELGVEVIDIGYSGGTIVSSKKDLSMMVVFPKNLELTHDILINKFVEIMSKYIDNVTIDGNDILIDGEKVCGTSLTYMVNTVAWTASISFDDYSEYITKICNKPAIKKPTYVKSLSLTKETLENEILAWLQKENFDNSLSL